MKVVRRGKNLQLSVDNVTVEGELRKLLAAEGERKSGYFEIGLDWIESSEVYVWR